jgi:hypothetical protein
MVEVVDYVHQGLRYSQLNLHHLSGAETSRFQDLLYELHGPVPGYDWAKQTGTYAVDIMRERERLFTILE